MLDYQFLGLVAVVLAVVSRGSLLPVVTVTALIGLLTLAGEAATRCYRRCRPQPRPHSAGPSGRRAGVAAPNPSDGNFHRWMAAAERVIRSPD